MSFHCFYFAFPCQPHVPCWRMRGERNEAMQLHGIHHLTAVSADAGGNRDFYTRVLGMRLVKKTVNQDDVSAYHLF